MAFDREIVALTVFCEASGEIPETRRAIAHSIFNRVKDGRFGKTPAAVCLKRYQYSEFLPDAGDNSNLERAASTPGNDPTMLDCLACYDEAFGGSPDISGGATHFFADTIAPPSWTKNATLCCKIGHTLFYRNVP